MRALHIVLLSPILNRSAASSLANGGEEQKNAKSGCVSVEGNTEGMPFAGIVLLMVAIGVSRISRSRRVA